MREIYGIHKPIHRIRRAGNRQRVEMSSAKKVSMCVFVLCRLNLEHSLSVYPSISLYKKPPDLGLCRELCQHCACLFHVHIFVKVRGKQEGHTMSMLCSWTWPHSGQEAFWSVICVLSDLFNQMAGVYENQVQFKVEKAWCGIPFARQAVCWRLFIQQVLACAALWLGTLLGYWTFLSECTILETSS